MVFISSFMCGILGFNQPIEYEGVALKSFFFYLPVTHVCFFNKFEDLIFIPNAVFDVYQSYFLYFV